MPASIHRYRVLFADGQTLDVLAANGDGSVLRAFVYRHHYGKESGKGPAADRIEGVADLGEDHQYVPGAAGGEVDDVVGGTDVTGRSSAPRAKRPARGGAVRGDDA
jgi:hypothetical protein